MLAERGRHRLRHCPPHSFGTSDQHWPRRECACTAPPHIPHPPYGRLLRATAVTSAGAPPTMRRHTVSAPHHAWPPAPPPRLPVLNRTSALHCTACRTSPPPPPRPHHALATPRRKCVGSAQCCGAKPWPAPKHPRHIYVSPRAYVSTCIGPTPRLERGHCLPAQPQAPEGLMRVCVCVCVWVLTMCVCVCVCVCLDDACVGVWEGVDDVCVCSTPRESCVCACACACA